MNKKQDEYYEVSNQNIIKKNEYVQQTIARADHS